MRETRKHDKGKRSPGACMEGVQAPGPNAGAWKGVIQAPGLYSDIQTGFLLWWFSDHSQTLNWYRWPERAWVSPLQGLLGQIGRITTSLAWSKTWKGFWNEFCVDMASDILAYWTKGGEIYRSFDGIQLIGVSRWWIIEAKKWFLGVEMGFEIVMKEGKEVLEKF